VLETLPILGDFEVINLTHHPGQLNKDDPQDDPDIFIPRNASQTPSPSFATLDEYDMARMRGMDMEPFCNERGSACCVPIQHPQTGQALLLGISHSKTRFKYKNGPGRAGNDLEPNHFTSSFYAIEAEAPYQLVAQTGRFCLGTARPIEYWQEGINHNVNPYYNISASNKKLWLMQEYDCPVIHYVSGMVEKVDDPSKIIIAYGVNNWYVTNETEMEFACRLLDTYHCLFFVFCSIPQMDVVEKEYIVNMLFSPADLI
jgi:hypothetical protein